MSKRYIRQILAVLTTVNAVACLITAVILFSGVKLVGGVDPLLMDDVTTKSIDARLVLSQSLFQVALLMIGALAAIIIAKPGETQIVFHKNPELLMFLSASVVLLISIVCYGFYLNKITEQFAAAVRARSKSAVPIATFIPDVFDENVNYLFKLQFVSLVAGVVNGALTLFSAYRLGGINHDHPSTNDIP